MRDENRVREDFWEKKKIIKTQLGTMNLVGFRTCLKISGSYLSNDSMLAVLKFNK